MAGGIAAAADAADSHPDRLWLVAPRGGGMQGEYTKQRGRDKYGQAIWRQVNGAGWLFSSGPEGAWCFAKKESDIGNKLGQVQSASPHRGKAPHEMPTWQYHDWRTWRIDDSIRVTASGEEFERAVSRQVALQDELDDGDRLWIVAPPYASLQGEYVKQQGRRERGQPVWSQVSGNGVLFSTSKGRWFVADGEAGIAMNGGVIATTAHHDGRPPQDMKQWQHFHGGKWLVDEALFVTARQEEGEKRLADQEAQAFERAARAPDRIWLVCAPKPGLQGEYVRHQGRLERGEAVWQQADGGAVLYSNGLGGLWCFANKESDILRNVGILQSTSPHGGRPPPEVSSWQYADGSSWRPDTSILVTASEEAGQRAFAEQHAEALSRAEAAPGSLWLVAPAQPMLQGEYVKQRGRLQRGQAYWRQAAGEGWLYSTAGGRWFVADREDAIKMCGGTVASLKPHGGRLPQECPEWQSYTDSSWHTDLSVRVTATRSDFEAAVAESPQSMIALPERLWLVASAAPQLQGEYEQVEAGRFEAGLAVWRQAAGAGRLYGRSSEGSWRVAEQESHVEAGRARLRSTGAAAMTPQQAERWQVSQEMNGTEDLMWNLDLSVRILTSAEEARAALEPSLRQASSADSPLGAATQALAALEPSPRPASPAASPRPASPVASPRGAAPPSLGLPPLELPLPRGCGGKVPTPRTAASAAARQPLSDRSPRPWNKGPSSPKLREALGPAAPQPAAARDRPDLPERVRAEVLRLLSAAGLSLNDAAHPMDVDMLVDQCICTLQEQDYGGAGPGDEVVGRVVLRALLVGWSRSRSVTHPMLTANADDGYAAEDGIPQLFCACQPEMSGPRARRHHFAGVGTPLLIQTSDGRSALETDENAICHQGCVDPCSVGGSCAIS